MNIRGQRSVDKLVKEMSRANAEPRFAASLCILVFDSAASRSWTILGGVPSTDRNEGQARSPATLGSERRDFFQQHDTRERKAKPELHHTADKQEQHQCPAAPEIFEAVNEAETKTVAH